MTDSAQQDFRHEALFYAGEDEFLAGTVPFLRDGAEAGTPMLVAVSAARARAIKAELNGEAEAVHFVDMAELGQNPSCIIPAWSDFVEQHAANGSALRGIGEPIWAGRSAAELVECQRHEALLNLAFADAPSFWLLCPYDTEALDPAVIEEAHRSHPFLVEDGAQFTSSLYGGLEPAATPFRAPLPEPPATTQDLRFDAEGLAMVRMFVSLEASEAGLDEDRAQDVLLAVNEVATNSIRHGGGHGLLRIWVEDGALLCEITDEGRIDQPLAGRMRPGIAEIGGYGLWLVNQLCDLVQIRSFASGTVVRLRVAPRVSPLAGSSL